MGSPSFRALDERLRRIEGLLGMLVRNADVERDERDLDGEIAKAYRRGYLAGHHAKRRGDELDVDGALARRRRPRADVNSVDVLKPRGRNVV